MPSCWTLPCRAIPASTCARPFWWLNATRLTPILVVTAKPAKLYRNFCMNLGATAYLEKPVNLAQLRGVLKTVLSVAPTERRGEPRTRLGVILLLRARDYGGREVELLTTADDASANGFFASCTLTLEPGAEVGVFLGGDGSRYAGRARLVRTESPGTAWQRCAFQFVEKTPEWILTEARTTPEPAGQLHDEPKSAWKM